MNTMKLLLSLAFAFALSAQTTPPASLMLSGPATAITGASITLTLTLVNGNGPAGVQWDMTGLPAGAVVTSSVPGKTTNCNVTRCLLIGINTAAIPDGAIATIKYTAP